MTATARPFLETLRDIRQGALLDELADHMQGLVSAVQDHGGKGSLTIKLTLKPAERGDGLYVLTDDVVVKAPQKPKHGTAMFATPDGNLSRKDPRQQSLGLQPVPAKTPQGGDAQGDSQSGQQAG